MNLSKSITNRLVFVATTTLMMLVWSSTHGQITRTWTNSSGSDFNDPSKWSPFGVPSALDTARFNSANSNAIYLQLVGDETVEELEVLDGTFAFRGAGTQGSDLRQLSVEQLRVEPDSQMWLIFGLNQRSLRVSASDSVAIGGQLNIIDGSRFSSPNDTIIDASGSTAQLRVSGEDSPANVSTWSVLDADIGDVGSGEVLILDGGLAEVEDLLVGREAGSSGRILVQGASSSGISSRLEMDGFMLAGRFGSSEIELRDGGQLYAPTLSMGAFASSTSNLLVSGQQNVGNPSHLDGDLLRILRGTAIVEDGGLITNETTYLDRGEAHLSGPESQWFASQLLEIGSDEGFSLTVDNGARFVAATTNISTTPGFSGNLVVSGQQFDHPSEFLNAGDLNLGGDSNQSGGTGTIDIMNHGRLVVGGALKLWNDGVVNMEPFGKIIAQQIDNSNGGQLNFNNGVLQVDQFTGELIQNGGTMMPAGDEAGSSIILGDYTQMAGKLILDIGGIAPGVQHDLVNTSGTAFIDGQLHIRLIGGFTPTSEDTFTVFVANNMLGFFVNIFNGQRMDTVDGTGSFVVNYGIGSAFDENRVVLSDFEPNFIVGDINGDGLVNLLDVAPFIDVLTTGDFVPAADANQDGAVNLLDVQPFIDLLII